MSIIFAMLAAIIAVTIGGAIVINLTTTLVTLGAAFLITLGLTVVVSIMQGGV